MPQATAPVPSLANLFADAFEQGRKVDFALFPQGVAASSPVNAAPYVCTAAAFRATFGVGAGRAALIERWEGMLDEMIARGLVPVFSLFGGSLLDRQRPAPRDIDCVVFYRLDDSADNAPAWLAERARRAAAEAIDARFVPVDGPAIVMAKSLAYFTLLYAQARPERRCHGLVLIDHLTDFG